MRTVYNKKKIRDVVVKHKEKRQNDPKILEFLSLKERIYLGALLRSGLNEDNSLIIDRNNYSETLAPTYDMEYEILTFLMSKRLIFISPESNYDYISIKDDDDSINYGVYEVYYEHNVESIENVNVINSLLFPISYGLEDIDEAFNIWKHICLEECLEYLIWSVNNILDTSYSVGKKTRSVFTNLLNDFSVSQIYGIIYKSVNNALRYYHEKQVYKKQATNTIVGNSLNFGERAISNNWDLSKYGRIKECPQSSISKIFFESLLKVGYDGFNMVPKKELLKFSVTTR